MRAQCRTAVSCSNSASIPCHAHRCIRCTAIAVLTRQNQTTNQTTAQVVNQYCSSLPSRAEWLPMVRIHHTSAHFSTRALVLPRGSFCGSGLRQQPLQYSTSCAGLSSRLSVPSARSSILNSASPSSSSSSKTASPVSVIYSAIRHRQMCHRRRAKR